MSITDKPLIFLKGKFGAGELGHAYILSGADSGQISSFAKEFVQYSNCIHEKKPCLQCRNCKAVGAGTFPDLLVVQSSNSESSRKNDKDMMEIDVDQVRDIQSFLAYKSSFGGLKAVIVEEADRMNHEAQSSFLKTLEEPKGRTVMFLVTAKPALLLPTIASRCQEIKCTGGQELQLSDQEKTVVQGFAKVMNGDFAERFNYVKALNPSASDFAMTLGALQKHFRQILVESVAAEKNAQVRAAANILKQLEELTRQNTITNVNAKLALEVLLMEI